MIIPVGNRVPHILELNSKLIQTLPVQVESFLAKVTERQPTAALAKKPAVAIIVEAGEAVTIAEHLVNTLQAGLATNSIFFSFLFVKTH